MGIKGLFKSIGKGFVKAGKGAAKVAPIITALTPAGSAVNLAATIISHLTDRAEELYPAQGTGNEKSAWVTVEFLRTMETVTGKNYDSPAGRALIQELINADVELKNMAMQAEAFYAEKLAAVQAYLASVSAPAQADTPA